MSPRPENRLTTFRCAARRTLFSGTPIDQARRCSAAEVSGDTRTSARQTGRAAGSRGAVAPRGRRVAPASASLPAQKSRAAADRIASRSRATKSR